MIRIICGDKVLSFDDPEAAEAHLGYSSPEADKRLKSVKPDKTVPKVGDTVVFNAWGLEQVFGSTSGLSHMRTLRMKITKVDTVSMTYPEPTFPVEVDNPEINIYLVDNNCFNIVERA